MKTKNNPTEWRELILEEVEIYRNTDCDNYENCLDLAIEKEWPGFNCLVCSQFESEVTVMTTEKIIEEIMDFLKEHELPQRNTIYLETDCALLVRESIKKLFRIANDLNKEKECVVKQKKSIADKDQIYNSFLARWNKCKMIQHKKVTTRMKKAIDKVLKNVDYPLSEVFQAFENYSFILNSPDYSWSYKWTMEDFLNRGLHKFVEEAQPFDNNKKEVKPVTNNPYSNFSCGGD